MTWIENYMENFISKSFVVVLVVWGAILLLMLTFAIITAVVASKKGRNGLGWFFIGLFTGLVGLAIALAMLPKRYYIGEDDE
jgi:hypothetical protein